MSRSRKKFLISGVCCVRAGEIKRAKKRANICVRRKEDLTNGNHYRKVSDRWHFPDDGKMIFKDSKVLRK